MKEICKRVAVMALFLGVSVLCMMAHDAPFSINGIFPYYDSQTNSYLVSVDEQLWGKDWSVSLELNDGYSWSNLAIDGIAVNGTYTFADISGEKWYELSADTGRGRESYRIFLTFLPIVYLGGDEYGYDYVTSDFSIQYQGKRAENMMANIKWRGGVTNTDGKHKRNYKVKLIDSQGNKLEKSFLGLRKDNIWILDAGQVDMFRMRNLIASQIWQDFACKPYYYDREPKALSATRGQMVEVFVGEKYQGIFNLCEPIDRKQMRLKKYEDDGTIHGGLWKASGHGDATFWNIPSEYDNTKEKNDVWELKYPKIDNLCPSDYSTLWNAIMFVATASDEDFSLHVMEYFDMPVLVDYYLLVAITNNFDICGKNIYWAVYDKLEDKKVTPAMWDLDCSMGQNYTDSPLHPDYVAYDNGLYVPNNIFHRLLRLGTTHFRELVNGRYAELRKSVFGTSSLRQRYIDAYNMISKCGAANREEDRWSYDTDISGLQLKLGDELNYICDWIGRRMEFLDKEFSFDPTSLSSSSSFRLDGSSDKCFTLQGTVASPYYKGVVIRKGKLEIRP